MDKFSRGQGGVNIKRGFCYMVFIKMIPRGKPLTFWQKVNDLAKPILQRKSLPSAYLRAKNRLKKDSCYGCFILNIVN